MNKDNNGGPAFPSHGSMGEVSCEGMSMRDYFAAQALPLAWEAEQLRPTGAYSQSMEPTYKGTAQRAYFMADAMLAARVA